MDYTAGDIAENDVIICLSDRDYFDQWGNLLLPYRCPITKRMLDSIISNNTVITVKELQEDVIEKKDCSSITIKKVVQKNIQDFTEKYWAADHMALNYAVENLQRIIDNIKESSNMCPLFCALYGYLNWVFCHSINVALLAAMLGFSLQYEEKLIDNLTLGALFHDIGRIMIPRQIINKPGKLNPHEYLFVQQHTSLGMRILKHKGIHPSIAEIAGFHHERMNQKGYPLGLNESEIDMNSQIVGLVDVFDALTTDRPHRKAFAIEEALDIIRLGRDIEYNPLLVDYFERALNCGEV